MLAFLWGRNAKHLFFRMIHVSQDQHHYKWNINAMGIDNLCKQNMWGFNQNNIEITHHAKNNSTDIKEEFMTQTY
jgi:hypothetical protein